MLEAHQMSIENPYRGLYTFKFLLTNSLSINLTHLLQINFKTSITKYKHSLLLRENQMNEINHVFPPLSAIFQPIKTIWYQVMFRHNATNGLTFLQIFLRRKSSDFDSEPFLFKFNLNQLIHAANFYFNQLANTLYTFKFLLVNQLKRIGQQKFERVWTP